MLIQKNYTIFVQLICTNIKKLTTPNLLIDQLELISELKNAPNIQIELEWDDDSGRYYCEEYEYEFGRYLFRFQVDIKQKRETTPATYLLDAEHSYSDLKIIIDLDEIWINDEEFFFSSYPSLANELTQTLKTKIEGYGIE